MSTVRPIETRYQGYRFRSRLEARWAVFFDTVGIAYDYEPEGFRIGTTLYLPDFRIKFAEDWYHWIEIKPDELSPDDEVKVSAFSQAIDGHDMPFDESGTVQECYVIVGPPYADRSGPSFEIRALQLVQPIAHHSVRYRWSHDYTFGQCPACGRVTITLNRAAITVDAEGSPVDGWPCYQCKPMPVPILPGFDPYLSDALIAAYTAARSARFEHTGRS